MSPLKLAALAGLSGAGITGLYNMTFANENNKGSVIKNGILLGLTTLGGYYGYQLYKNPAVREVAGSVFSDIWSGVKSKWSDFTNKAATSSAAASAAANAAQNAANAATNAARSSASAFASSIEVPWSWSSTSSASAFTSATTSASQDFVQSTAKSGAVAANRGHTRIPRALLPERSPLASSKFTKPIIPVRSVKNVTAIGALPSPSAATRPRMLRAGNIPNRVFYGAPTGGLIPNRIPTNLLRNANNVRILPGMAPGTGVRPIRNPLLTAAKPQYAGLLSSSRIAGLLPEGKIIPPEPNIFYGTPSGSLLKNKLVGNLSLGQPGATIFSHPKGKLAIGKPPLRWEVSARLKNLGRAIANIF